MEDFYQCLPIILVGSAIATLGYVLIFVTKSKNRHLELVANVVISVIIALFMLWFCYLINESTKRFKIKLDKETQPKTEVKCEYKQVGSAMNSSTMILPILPPQPE